MFRRLSLSVLWLLAVWTWVNIAHTFLGFPDLGLLAGLLAAGGALLIRRPNAESVSTTSLENNRKRLTTFHS
jgi:hypothetical protein